MIKITCLISETYSNYQTGGFNDHMRFRTNCLIDELKAGITVFQIDSDIIIFKPLQYFINKIGNEDILAQREHNADICTGFMIVKPTETSIKFFESTLEKMAEIDNDERAANAVLKENFNIKVAYFDTKDITNYGVISGGKIWEGQDFDLPACHAFHANYTLGQENKERLLDKVMQKCSILGDK